jgi:hypothetical protein
MKYKLNNISLNIKNNNFYFSPQIASTIEFKSSYEN